jgi:phenylalanyl-tRNA synthetase beta chain
MRTTLWGGLLQTLRHNLNRQQDRVRLFELGRIYLSGSDGLLQPMKLGGLAYGPAQPEQWSAAARRVDFFDVKGDIERLFDGSLEFQRGEHPSLHPGQCARILLNGQGVGWLGSLHPALTQSFDLPTAPVLFEIDSEAVSGRVLPRHVALSRFPQVRRDLAFVVAKDILAGEVLDTLRQSAPAFIQSLGVFDEYRGPGLAENQKSLAFRVVMQDTQRTLTDKEVEDAVANMADAVIREHDASLRS